MVSQLDSSACADGPVRTCVGCRKRAAKRELLRVVAGTDAEDRAHSWSVVPDPDGTAPGRGAHLHPTADCLARAERTRAFTRALRRGNQGGAPGLERLREHLASTEEQPANDQHPTRSGSTSS